MGQVRALWDLRAADLPEAGGKALGLARLADLGVDVPDGFVVTSSFFEAARRSVPFEPEPEALARSLPEVLARRSVRIAPGGPARRRPGGHLPLLGFGLLGARGVLPEADGSA